MITVLENKHEALRLDDPVARRRHGTLFCATASSKVSLAVIEHAGLTTTVTYDEQGRESSRSVSGTGVDLAGAVLARDAEGRRTSWSIGS